MLMISPDCEIQTLDEICEALTHHGVTLRRSQKANTPAILQAKGLLRYELGQIPHIRDTEAGKKKMDGIKASANRIFEYHVNNVRTMGGEPLELTETELKALDQHMEFMNIVKQNKMLWEMFIEPTKKEMERLASLLPAFSFVAETKGLGVLTFAKIIAETGNLDGYPSPFKMWKRLGLAVIEGQRQRHVANDKKLNTRMGYNKNRRSMAFLSGESMIKLNWDAHTTMDDDGQKVRERVPLKYRAIYDKRKVHEEEMSPELTPKHRHRRAQRYMEKRLLKDIWVAWNRETGANKTNRRHW